MRTVSLAGLLKIELPTATVRLCDGGLIRWSSETFTSKDATFGTIASLDALSEGVGDEVPALEMALNPTNSAVPSDLSQPGFQTARVRFWIAEFNTATGAVVGTPDLQFDGQIDQTKLAVGRDTRRLSMTIVSTAERLFNRAEGNSLSPAFHHGVWPGELGHDQATGLTIPVAWGAEAPVTGGQTPYFASGGPSWRAK
jgi:hypothetical protein